MSGSLFDPAGQRKYVLSKERIAFVSAALQERPCIATFCLTLAITGARLSEVLGLDSVRIDFANQMVVLETLKQRRRNVYRGVPVPGYLIEFIDSVHNLRGGSLNSNGRLWPWGRTYGWTVVRRIMRDVGIPHRLCKPRSLRHGFAVEAVQSGVPLNLVQRWLGHARLETTAIYAAAIGDEERALAARSWLMLERVLTTKPNGDGKLVA